MATALFVFNGQLVQSAGIAGPGLITCPDDDEAQALISQGYAALAATWQGGE